MAWCLVKHADFTFTFTISYGSCVIMFEIVCNILNVTAATMGFMKHVKIVTL